MTKRVARRTRRLSTMTPMSSFIVVGTLSRPRGMTSLKKLTKTEVETKMETRKETFSPDCNGTRKTSVFMKDVSTMGITRHTV